MVDAVPAPEPAPVVDPVPDTAPAPAADGGQPDPWAGQEPIEPGPQDSGRPEPGAQEPGPDGPGAPESSPYWP